MIENYIVSKRRVRRVFNYLGLRKSNKQIYYLVKYL
ncbi:Uncharacterised protein [[Clostridium] sordellii]|nr:Uncharacterised protein [[Clostridium] sordellii] [Paeniclostridium sordellii]